MKNLHSLGLSIAIALLLSACGGGDSSTTVTPGNTTPPPPSTTASKLALKQAANNAELETLIKQQMLEIYATVRPEIVPCKDDVCIMPVMATATNAPTAVADTAKSVSSTNTQETTVDEADRIKTDGTYLYTTATDQPNVRIFKTGGANNTLVKDLPLSNDSNTRLSGLYLDGTKLAALAEEQPMYSIWDRWFIPSDWQNQQTQLHLLNVANPENPSQTAKLTVDGQVISSRRIGSTLYVATRHSPTLPNLVQYPTTEADAAANRTRINNATLADFLPDYQLNGGSKNEIFSGDDCFMTQYTDKKSYQTSIVSLLAIDLNSAAPIPQGKCFAGDTETLYASIDAIYLATTSYSYPDNAFVANAATVSTSIAYYPPTITTDLHKFSLANGINYRGSGRVEGHLGWQQDLKPFRLSEYNGVLRLLTYTGDTLLSNASPARLYTMQENTATQALDILAKLPNTTRPAPLGKPGEQIYATRFLGDKAYLVTFRQTDPLYVLDLSKPADPYIVSELQIAGFSDYLHPIGDHYLLGIGKDGGVKLSLIDLTDPTHPYEKQKIIIGKTGTNTAVSQTHHAFTSLQQGNNLQVALPISLHEQSDFGWTQDELYRLNINTQTGTMQALAPIIGTTASATTPYSNDQGLNDRSVMIGEFIHYLHGDKVISQAW
ncbi:MAG: hypothetical protein BWK73_08455 [Thiothrix lacustris]|uniref:Beta propeller domain-containing protein n=1 Tax=Thiothrix lacustris TaxID=525917 RepID=A0A1Y1QVL1_9GAMM|nr:MAG: hypothetical protein BWK73_08455 [Thiothrix lacustris]